MLILLALADEDPSLRIESSAIINLCGVSKSQTSKHHSYLCQKSHAFYTKVKVWSHRGTSRGYMLPECYPERIAQLTTINRSQRHLVTRSNIACEKPECSETWARSFFVFLYKYSNVDIGMMLRD